MQAIICDHCLKILEPDYIDADDMAIRIQMKSLYPGMDNDYKQAHRDDYHLCKDCYTALWCEFFVAGNMGNEHAHFEQHDKHSNNDWCSVTNCNDRLPF